MSAAASSALVGILAVGALATLAIIAEPRDSMIASSDVNEVCATDGLPGSAYSRAHRVVARKPVPGYQLDHRVSLCAGGADNDANVWLQPIEEALVKDELEWVVCRAICRDRTMTLADGQGILMNWRANLWRIGR